MMTGALLNLPVKDGRLASRVLIFLFASTGCPKKMSPIIFCGTTSLPVIEYSNFFINENITLIIAFFRTKIFNRSPSRVT
jgi:hypothetical protein